VQSRYPDQQVLLGLHGNAIGLYLNHLDPHFDVKKWAAMKKPDLFAVRVDQ
jgi:hypothetical protein